MEEDLKKIIEKLNKVINLIFKNEITVKDLEKVTVEIDKILKG